MSVPYTKNTTATTASYIGEAKVKEIMTQAAGVNGIFVELEMEADDGRVLYKGEMRSGWMEYEFEVDALTNTILDWDD